MPPLLLLAALWLAAPAPTSPHHDREPELGTVHWGRDLEDAFASSRHSGRPVLVLFDEVPGCATCRGFGQDVLSHPLLSEAIECEFAPVFVANNRAGRDAAVLTRFGEPAWNNPVVRLLDAHGQDLIPRADGLYSAHEIAGRLVAALRAAGRPVPGYLTLAHEESQLAHRREATFAMNCFWEGEARLGAWSGVLDVQAVHTAGGEGVRVVYDESRLSREALVRAAQQQACSVHTGDERGVQSAAGSDHRHALARSPLARLALTPMQAMRVNAALAQGGDGLEWLTPSQRSRALELTTGARASH